MVLDYPHFIITTMICHRDSCLLPHHGVLGVSFPRYLRSSGGCFGASSVSLNILCIVSWAASPVFWYVLPPLGVFSTLFMVSPGFGPSLP